MSVTITSQFELLPNSLWIVLPLTEQHNDNAQERCSELKASTFRNFRCKTKCLSFRWELTLQRPASVVM